MEQLILFTGVVRSDLNAQWRIQDFGTGGRGQPYRPYGKSIDPIDQSFDLVEND